MATNEFIWPSPSGQQCVYTIVAKPGIGAGSIEKEDEYKVDIVDSPLDSEYRLREDNR